MAAVAGAMAQCAVEAALRDGATDVIVENGGSGSSVAAPIARQIMDAYLLDQS